MARVRRVVKTAQRVIRGTLAPPPLRQIDDPLGYIDADHSRQRSACDILRRMAREMAIGRVLARDLATFLTRDLPIHHRDEDEDLFPLLLKRSLPQDELAPILAELSADHHAAARAAERIADRMRPGAGTGPVRINLGFAALARDYAGRERRHIAIEKAIVMVIARKRLKVEDLKRMSRSMKARRGVEL
jgi:hemerythrin-like domain-containing protein